MPKILFRVEPEAVGARMALSAILAMPGFCATFPEGHDGSHLLLSPVRTDLSVLLYGAGDRPVRGPSLHI